MQYWIRDDIRRKRENLRFGLEIGRFTSVEKNEKLGGKFFVFVKCVKNIKKKNAHWTSKNNKFFP